jgi:uncharacterized protein YecE (DUF72 family)
MAMAHGMKLWVGTSGFQYPEWKGKFYPEDLSKAKMLAFYASQFNSTESNYTFRSIPSAKTIARWCAETPDEFRFSLKAPQRVTHFAKLRECSEVVSAFVKAVNVLGEKMGPVLFQLPPTFEKDSKVLRDFLRGTPKNLRVAFEFRHESWFDDEVFGILLDRNAALCVAESEDLATPQVATADFGYLRPRREDYTASDIKKWASFVRSQSKVWSEVFAYFKHEETCVGPGFAKAFIKALGG